MDIAINGKNLDVGEALHAHIAGELETAVGKYFAKAHDAKVVLSREAHLFRADIQVHPVRGMLVQGRGAAADPYAAFDGALERIAKQLRRYKRRLTNHHKGRGGDETTPAQQYVIASEAEEEEAPADGKPVIIAELQTEIATLSVSEAVMRLDLADVPAMMFRNRSNGGLNVVFRRPDGNIGWIDPQNTPTA